MNQLATQGDLLLAHPRMSDPHFAGSVVLLVEHGEDGAFGLVLNKPYELLVNEEGVKPPFVFHGGPVDSESIWGVSTQEGNETRKVLEGVHWGNGEQVAGAGKNRLFLGYSGWDPGQLERELVEDVWIVVPATPTLVFDCTPESLWARLVSETSAEFAWVKSLSGDSKQN
ncbi:YqgE/AlgH family protein [bacterium]|nr:YqgE/AlgH family protein [bacterium]